MQLTRFLMPLALASTLVAAAPAPKSESLVSADLNLNDLIRLSADVNYQARDVEDAFEKRSPRFMPPGHGAGPVNSFSWKKAAALAFQSIVKAARGKEALLSRDGLSRRDFDELEEHLDLFIRNLETETSSAAEARDLRSSWERMWANGQRTGMVNIFNSRELEVEPSSAEARDLRSSWERMWANGQKTGMVNIFNN